VFRIFLRYFDWGAVFRVGFCCLIGQFVNFAYFNIIGVFPFINSLWCISKIFILVSAMVVRQKQMGVRWI